MNFNPKTIRIISRLPFPVVLLCLLLLEMFYLPMTLTRSARAVLKRILRKPYSRDFASRAVEVKGVVTISTGGVQNATAILLEGGAYALIVSRGYDHYAVVVLTSQMIEDLFSGAAGLDRGVLDACNPLIASMSVLGSVPLVCDLNKALQSTVFRDMRVAEPLTAHPAVATSWDRLPDREPQD